MHREIAVVGISTELPSGSWSDSNLDHESFFEFLLQHGQAYERIPADRFNIQGWKGRDLGQICTEQGSFLKGAQLFDNVEFGVSAKDARNMAPGTRRLIENAFLALLDSGIEYRSRNIGCFASSTNHNVIQISETDEYEIEGSFAGTPSMIANKVSYHLDLLGPSIPTDTACSSSATALHLAVNSLLQGDCEAAVVAGAQINHHFLDWMMYSQGSVLAPDGKCKPFDASANGFSRSEGVVAIVIKPLENAVNDGDYIYGTILGTAINGGGNAASPGAPIPEAQTLAMKKAFERSGRSPQDVDYVECHATGTHVGDPAEANWVGQQFRREETLVIGSVKGNLGHSEITAFLASLSKVLSIFRHKVIPPNVNLTRPNPAIKWDEHNMVAPTVATGLSCRSGVRSLIAIASSGIGGTNAHVVMQEPPSRNVASCQLGTKWPVLLLAGGLSPRSAMAMASNAADTALAHPEHQHLLAIKICRGARQMSWRTFTILDDATSPTKPPQLPPPVQSPRAKPPIVFVFSGQGPQHINMGRQLFAAFSAFRSSVLESDRVFKARKGYSLVDDIGLFGDKAPNADLEEWPIHITLPALLIFQIALYDLLLDLGVRPDVLIGHSAGETALVYASQAGSRTLAVELAIARGQAFSAVESFGGTMAALSCSAAKVKDLISKVASKDSSSYPVDIACYNAPEAVAIAGPSDQIDQIIALARLENITGRKIRTRTPVHSTMIELCQEQYIRSVEEAFARHGGSSKPQLRTYSTCHGDLFDRPYDTDYFWNNARHPVLFTETLAKLLSHHPNAVFMEISAHPVLSAYINEAGVPISHTLAGARRSKTPVEYRTLLQSLGQLTLAGYNSVSFHRLNFNDDANFDLPIKLPEYPFMRKSFPFYLDGPASLKKDEPHNGPLNHEYLRINQDTHPWLVDHTALGEAIMPACGFVEMAFEFGAAVLMEVNFRKILPTARDKPLPVRVDLDGSYWSVTTSTSGKGPDLHADGYLSFEEPPCLTSMPDMDALRSRSEYVTRDAFYAAIGGLEYGPMFRRVLEMHINSKEAIAKIQGYTPDLINHGSYYIHPAILDCCIQPVEHFPGDIDPDSYYLPSRIRNVILHRNAQSSTLPEIFYAYHVLQSWQPDLVVVDVTIFDERGSPICSMQELQLQRHSIIRESKIERHFEMIYQPGAIPITPLLANKGSEREIACLRPELQDKIIDVGNSSVRNAQPNSSVAEVVSLIVDKSLSSISSDSRRVLNIMFIAADGNGLHERVSRIFDRHHSLYINYIVCNDTKRVLTTWNTTGRLDTLAFDQPTSTQSYEQNSFDLVYVVEPDTLGGSPSTIAEVTRTLVADGGHLFFIGAGSSDTGCAFGMQDNGFERLASYSHHQHVLRVVEFVFHLPEVPGDFQKDTHFIQYAHGRQVDLISILRDFDTTEACDIWIMADEGGSGDEATGFVRTLRKEYLNWNMKLAIFPSLFTEDGRTGFLKKLPHRLQCETEIIVSSNGEISVPRVFPFPSYRDHQTASIGAFTHLSSGHVVVQTSARSSDTGYTSFIGSILASSSPDLAIGSTVIGITTSMQSEFVVASSSLRVLDSVSDNAANIISLLPGFVVAALAPTLSAFTHPKRLPAWRVLLTHSKSSIGRVVRDLYRIRDVEVVEAGEDVTLYQLGQLGRGCFDLVITGYRDPKYLQVIDLLLRQDTGRLFSWNAGRTSLASICAKEPWHIGDAIKIALSHYRDYLQNSGCVEMHVEPVQPAMDSRCQSLIFRPDRTYLLLGGLGSLGPYVALWMYERGARHIALSSRRANGLYPGSSTSRQSRIIRYLRSRRDLNLQVVVFDPLDAEKTKKHISAISPLICGSIILTASPSDRFSLNLTTDDFKKSRDASLLVLHTLQSVLNIENLDFLVNFGSVTSLCGNAGQSSYTSAKTALEGELRQFKKAFSFICPPISGTTLINELYAVKSASTVLAWQISPSKMFQWLEDAMLLLKSGQRMWTYIPDWDWEDVAKALGLPAFATYLFPQQNTDHGPSTVDDNNEHVTELITRHLDLRPEDLSDDVSLASYGLDSLSASRLSSALRKAFGLKISQIQLLADVSTGDIRKRISAREKENQSTSSLDRIREEMAGYLRKYTSTGNNSSAWRSNTSHSIPSAKKVVLVTGTTGALGANILHQLILDPDVETIYTVNRLSKTMSLPEKQKIVWRNQGLPEGLEEEAKVHCLAYDITAVRLGLPDTVYEEVASSVTHIIHNAWISDFSQPLSGYDDLLKGTRNLIDLALSSRLPTPPSFAFISTTGVCQFNASSVPCPELPITLEQVMALDKEQSSDHAGYIQSKWIAEQIIGHFRSLAPLKASIIRVGQLTGAPNGSWDSRQWLPAVVKSGLSVGCLPDGDDVVSWLPVSIAAAAVVDLMDTDGVTHVVHPRPVSWDTIMKSAGTLLDIPLLPYADWFRRLEASAEGDKGQDLGNNPAIKLLDFFRLGMQKTSRCATESMGLLASVSTERARSLSLTLSHPSISQLGQRDVESWIAYWRRTGYLPSSPP